MARRGNRRGGKNRTYERREPRKAATTKTTNALDNQAWTKTAGGYTNAGKSLTFKTCTQLHIGQRFELDRGRFILASSYKDTMGKHRETERDLGFYLDEDWAKRAYGVLATPGVDFPRDEPTPMVLYPWPDYGTPSVTLRGFDVAVRWLLKKIEHGERIETGCYGGHGRTGTLLACLLVAQGHEAGSSISRVRLTYCDWAIEGTTQEHFVRQYHAYINGLPIPPMPKDEWHTPKPSTPSTITSYASSLDAYTYGDEDEYEEWLRLNTAANLAGGRSSWEDAIVSGDFTMPDGWELWEDEEIEDYLWTRGYHIERDHAPDDMPMCEEPPCPHPMSCDEGAGECLRAWLSSRKEGAV